MTIRKGTAFALLTLLLGCTTKNDASIQIAALCGFPTDATQCTWSAQCDSILMNVPWVATRVSTDPSVLATRNNIQNAMYLPVQIDNHLRANDNVGQFRTNTNDFTIEEYRLSFTSRPPLAIPSYTVKQNNLVPAEGSTVVMVTVIPQQTMAVIDAANLSTTYVGITAPNARVEVEIKAYGHTRDGQHIETEGWVLPVDVLDVDVPAGRFFDPTCSTTSYVPPTAACPNVGQSGVFGCN